MSSTVVWIGQFNASCRADGEPFRPPIWSYLVLTPTPDSVIWIAQRDDTGVHPQNLLEVMRVTAMPREEIGGVLPMARALIPELRLIDFGNVGIGLHPLSDHLLRFAMNGSLEPPAQRVRRLSLLHRKHTLTKSREELRGLQELVERHPRLRFRRRREHADVPDHSRRYRSPEDF